MYREPSLLQNKPLQGDSRPKSCIIYLAIMTGSLYIIPYATTSNIMQATEYHQCSSIKAQLHEHD